MSKTLEEAVAKVKALPEEAQDAIAEELMERVADFSETRMNDAQREEVKRRLAKPRRYATDEEVRAVLRRYNPAL